MHFIVGFGTCDATFKLLAARHGLGARIKTRWFSMNRGPTLTTLSVPARHVTRRGQLPCKADTDLVLLLTMFFSKLPLFVTVLAPFFCTTNGFTFYGTSPLSRSHPLLSSNSKVNDFNFRAARLPLLKSTHRGRAMHDINHMEMKSGEEKGKAGFLEAFYKFTRPHTIRGTILASCACVTRVTLDCIRTQSFIEWSLLRTAFFGLIALLCGNAYIVGINQIYDVDIDKVIPIACRF
jgi:hypothetical protein